MAFDTSQSDGAYVTNGMKELQRRLEAAEEEARSANDAVEKMLDDLMATESKLQDTTQVIKALEKQNKDLEWKTHDLASKLEQRNQNITKSMVNSRDESFSQNETVEYEEGRGSRHTSEIGRAMEHGRVAKAGANRYKSNVNSLASSRPKPISQLDRSDNALSELRSKNEELQQLVDFWKGNSEQTSAELRKLKGEPGYSASYGL